MGRLMDAEPQVLEALHLIDQALAVASQRELMSTGEVADLLLDMRTLLTFSKREER